ncbi:21832_t:CDS:2, partial [Entrophospora sp. SA101]
TRQGVIFVDIPANIMKLGKAIGEGYLSHNTAILGDTSSEFIITKYGKPPIIVYDNVSQFVHKNSEILDILQDDVLTSPSKVALILYFVMQLCFELLLNPFSAVIKLQIVTEVKKKFDFTKLLRGQSCHEVGKHVIGALLVSKEIDTEVFREFFGDENPVKF